MDPEEFRALLDQTGLSPSAFGELAGRDARSGQRWVAGSRPVLPGAATLLRLMVALRNGARFEDLAALLRAEAERLDEAAKPEA